MSREAREWVWEHSSSRGTARLVLLSIADRVPDEQCAAWASLSSLIERTNASRTAVRDALGKLIDSGELEQRDDFQGPQRATVYRLPLAAAFLAKVKAALQEEPTADVAPATEADPVPELRAEELRQYGIWPKDGTDSGPSRRIPAGSGSGPSRRNPTPRRYGFRPLEGADSDPQNRSEPKVNRNGSSSAAVVSASQWQLDPATHAWARQQGHLARLGEDGLRSADAKWRAYRASSKPRSAGAWAADWRAWIARERTPAPGRPRLYALPSTGPAPDGGMTRAEAHTAALLAALDEPTGTE
ncbi:helix-turn-helix domain-containing protein [Streptomyces ipomoeae]|uniref:helix-turn-helix domain-containing protein n=1 Tax=Streptomyces ipomoeae TaxID=103232 RepID=UPI0011475390|nr:helix-turn-helix domain-containing protein [Streptomyces ipomoeae]MDX2823131.1 helix-turn-helix domain-containing protein [Streptomyces ipomoeae]MDX2823134.1 helix-turn-helix domain-containing protein [Streptomyces ipomoeae]MDX2878664.1 helix-turn-helix domain-containing protein [Streptomyces ipomoeae]TQE19726.1 helix-turn-helix domain-containing protein [Streptomyces ipomoeae]